MYIMTYAHIFVICQDLCAKVVSVTMTALWLILNLLRVYM